jgi:hypothetical protein
MKNIKHIATESLHSLGNAATKRVIKQFASKYHMVYFGHVDPQEDEYELVRGLTVSTTHVDDHYTVGAYNKHDIILVERRNTFTYPGRPHTSYRWLIAQIDLNRGGMPHIFIDCHHHDALFYANAFLSQNGMQDVSAYFNGVSATFARNCKLFAHPAAYNAVGLLLTPEVAETIAKHFHQFDYEITDDRVLIYASNHNVTPATLEEMLRIGAWLADHCNAVQLD